MGGIFVEPEGGFVFGQDGKTATSGAGSRRDASLVIVRFVSAFQILIVGCKVVVWKWYFNLLDLDIAAIVMIIVIVFSFHDFLIFSTIVLMLLLLRLFRI